MALRIEDYALIGDVRSAALVGRDGSIDWLCWPRFDSGACFAALLGTPEQGRWRIAPADPAPQVTRHYRDGSLVLQTVFHAADGEVAVTDCMPQCNEPGPPRLLRSIFTQLVFLDGRTAPAFEKTDVRENLGERIVTWRVRIPGRTVEGRDGAPAGPLPGRHSHRDPADATVASP